MQEVDARCPNHGTNEPVTVPFAATPAGKPPSIRDWANRYVWTDRMLQTLEQECAEENGTRCMTRFITG